MAESISIFGGGSWGTALAWLLGGKGHPVTLFCRREEQAAAVEAARENARYLPGLALPPCVRATAALEEAAASASFAVLALPTQELRSVAQNLRDRLRPGAALVLACKGLELGTGLRPSEVLLEVGGGSWRGRLAALSGPNLAGEVVRRIPTTAVIAAANPVLARRLQELFSTSFFRVYTNPDVTGVELGGALKNPVAIAAGISDGLGFGSNTKAALITRGLAEIGRLGRAAGAEARTFAGLSGLGDLVVTCHSPLSRNYRLGRALGEGSSLEEALAALGQVAEGVPTCEAACLLAARLGVEMPITSELRLVLAHGKSPLDAVSSLMARAFRDESGADD